MYFFVELPFHLGVKLVNNISLLIQHHQGQETFPFNTGMVSIFNIVWPQFYLLLIQLFITSAFHQSNNGLNKISAHPTHPLLHPAHPSGNHVKMTSLVPCVMPLVLKCLYTRVPCGGYKHTLCRHWVQYDYLDPNQAITLGPWASYLGLLPVKEAGAWHTEGAHKRFTSIAFIYDKYNR